MKSKFDGVCPDCGSVWLRGDLIEQWLGKWVHAACKAARRASVASEGVRTELPAARMWADSDPLLDFSVVKNRKVRKATIIR